MQWRVSKQGSDEAWEYLDSLAWKVVNASESSQPIVAPPTRGVLINLGEMEYRDYLDMAYVLTLNDYLCCLYFTLRSSQKIMWD